MPDLPRALLTVPQVAERLALSDSHTYRLVEAGEIAAVRIGRRAVRVTEDAVAEFVARKTSPATHVRRVARIGRPA